ncbi:MULTISPECIES: glycosyltransferase [unclassified Streptomyces]|uniref:glycosyltransferase n=1 Tax=unclassified Streptomyces TaxID=2593676 RepID=UPI002F90E930
MKILFVAAGSQATVFALSPLATAARNGGHQVFMAAHADMMPVVAGAGLPGIALTSRPLGDFLTFDRAGRPLTIPADPAEGQRFAGGAFGRMAAANIEPLLALARDWRPDLVVGGTLSYAAGLLAAHLGVPFVRQAWDAIEADAIHPGAALELRPELDSLGLERFPEPELFIDICPPGVRPPGAAPAQLMRWIPGNQQRALEPWMYRRGDRPRVCVTSGSRASRASYDNSYEFLRDMATRIGALDVDLVVAAPEAVAADLRAEFAGVRAGWIPLDVVAPTCDLLLHHAGGVTSMTGMNAGLPQLLIPNGPILVPAARRMAAYGAAITLMPGEDSADAIADACGELLADPAYRGRARDLAREISGLPLPAQLVGVLENL